MQTILSILLVVSVFTLAIVVLCSTKATLSKTEPIWGFDKAAVIQASATTENIGQFANTDTKGIITAILGTFAIGALGICGI